MSDEPRDNEDEQAPREDGEDMPRDDGEGAAPEPTPPPSTWAGRRAHASSEDAEDAEDAPQEPEAGSSGESDDFEADEVPGRADELADPPDEFAFSDSDGAEEADADEGPDVANDAGEGVEAEGAAAADSEPEAAAAGETIEADTLSLADREAAKEAAMDGVRARTQQHEVEPSQRTAQPSPVTGSESAAAEAGGGPVARQPGETGGHPIAEPAGAGGAGEPPKRGGIGWRFVAAASLIIASIAAATAVYSILFLSDFAKGIGHNEKFASIKEQLAGVDGGGPQTIMFLGSDSRAKNPEEIKKGEDPGRSDTTLLARINPDNNTINLLSLPRDLKVNIPGHGVDKLNAAYTYGGQDLTLKTVKNLLSKPGEPFDVNHVVNIDFDGFYDAVNAIDCVYIDVDHHYYHSNEGLDPSEYYDEIDVKAGYQRLCGYNALNYVRYRHNDNDLVRGARQQDFIRELRQRIPPEKVFDASLRNIFIKYTTSDISDGTSLLEVLKTLFGARGAPVRQIQFEGDIGDATSTYVTATSKQIEKVRDEFLGSGPAAPESGDSSGSSDKKKSGKKKSGKKKPKKDEKIDPSAAGTVDVTGNTDAQGEEFLQKKATDFPIFYPTQAIPSASLGEDSRAYPILGPEPDKKKVVYRGYKFVFSFMASGYEAYYGVEGTDWKDPPILDDPSDTETIDGRDYELFYDGGKLRLVGFKTSDGAYWVQNTLTNLLTEQQMLSIAESMRELKN